MLIFESQSLDVYRNLAIEEYLMDQKSESGPVLFLWRSECAVVIGKNQNPWRECRLDLMQQENIPLARRISGGGTVYHDAGNLNYCVIVSREKYCECDAYNMVFRALNALGVRAEKTGKSNLSVGGLKFSGNAFAFRSGRAMHHGTLLLDTDLMKLNRYLGGSMNHIETHAIASVPAEVTNLKLDLDKVVCALKESFRFCYGGEEIIYQSESNLDKEVLSGLESRKRTDEWLFGITPRFKVLVNGGELEVVKGVVVTADGDGVQRYLKKPFRDVAFSAFAD